MARAVDDAVAPRGSRSLAVYVNADGAQCVGVAVAVRERVVIDDTFATRDLVHHGLRSPRYWVLALRLDDPQLLHGRGATLHSSPLTLRDATEHPSSRSDGRGKERSDVLDVRRTRRLRALDMALDDALTGNADPVLVVGAEPTVSRFLHQTRHATRIEGVVRRAPERDPARLLRSVEGAISDVLGHRRMLALAALERSVGAATHASGIDQVWRQVQRNGGGLLVVEELYEHPAVVAADGGLSAAPDAAAAGVIDDVVDDVIEHVLAAGGRVEIVPDGVLADHQRIAYVARSGRAR